MLFADLLSFETHFAMSVSCGRWCTALVDENGCLWICGKDNAQLALHSGLAPARVRLLANDVVDAGALYDAQHSESDPVFMVSNGKDHTFCVTTVGDVWNWGEGEGGRLGHGEETIRHRPTRLRKEVWGGFPAVMVSCGAKHTLILTSDGRVFSFGYGHDGQLGLANLENQLSPRQIDYAYFRDRTSDRPAHIVMVAAGGAYSIALSNAGNVYTWGSGTEGQLGQPDITKEPLVCCTPVKLGGAAWSDNASVGVLVSAGGHHTAVVTGDGTLWMCGHNNYGQLGLGDMYNRFVPTQLAKVFFGGDTVLMAACATSHTLVVTQKGKLWAFGMGMNLVLGVNLLSIADVPDQHVTNTEGEDAQSQYKHEHSEDIIYDSEDEVLDSEDKVLESEDEVLDSEDEVLESEDQVLDSEDKLYDSDDDASEGGDSDLYSISKTCVSRALPGPKSLSVSTADYHSAAITENGLVYTWGTAVQLPNDESSDDEAGWDITAVAGAGIRLRELPGGLG